MRIGDLARLGGVSVRMLRHYHEIGLLEPHSVSRSSGYRIYEAGQLDELRRIVELKELGLPLDVVADIVNDRCSADEVRHLLRSRRESVIDELEVGQARLRAIDRLLHTMDDDRRLDDGTDPDAEIEIVVTTKAIAPRVVAQLSAVAESWAPTDIGPVIRSLYPELIARLDRAEVPIVGPSTAWYEDTDEGRIAVNATLGVDPTSGPLPDPGGVTIVELPAVPLAATTIHTGTMDDGDRTYQALLDWIDRHEHRPIGYGREVDIECHPDRTWITELQIAIEPKDPRT